MVIPITGGCDDEGEGEIGLGGIGFGNCARGLKPAQKPSQKGLVRDCGLPPIRKKREWMGHGAFVPGWKWENCSSWIGSQRFVVWLGLRRRRQQGLWPPWGKSDTEQATSAVPSQSYSILLPLSATV